MKTPLILKLGLWAIFFTTLSHAQEKKGLQALDYFNLEYVSDPQVSPDGTKIAYLRNFKDVLTDRHYSNIWIINSDGTQNRPLTQGNQNDSSPRWSHDGTKLAYRSNGQDERTKLFVYDFFTQLGISLTNTAEPPSPPTWSYDDKQLAFTQFVPIKKENLLQLPAKPDQAEWNAPPIYIDEMNYRADGEGYLKSGYRHIFTLGIEGGTPVQHTFNSFDYGNPVWMPDSQHLVFSANLHENHQKEPQNTEIYTLKLSDNSIISLTNRFGPDINPVVSTDGSLIAYTGFDDTFQGYENSRLYVMRADGSQTRVLTENLDRSAANPRWAAQGKGVFFQYENKGKIFIAHADLSGKLTDYTNQVGGLDIGRPYVDGSFTVSAKNQLAFTQSVSGHPADLAIWDKKTITTLTRLNADIFSARVLGKIEEIQWKSSFDGQEIQGWVVTPPNFDPSKKYPFILEIHGGPFAMYGPVFAYEIQRYAAEGYVVLYANPRGSTGYGKAFGNAIHHDYPNHDYEDLMSGVDAVIANGYIDADNLFVTGGSGGGVLTAWMVGKTDRFKAAVVAKPVINWSSFVLHADAPAFFGKYWFGKMPWEDIENYWRRSPLSLAGNVKTPTMLLTGEQDYRTPISESEQYYAALKQNGVETAMVRIPNASHGLNNRPSMLMSKSSVILSWFNHYRDKK